MLRPLAFLLLACFSGFVHGNQYTVPLLLPPGPDGDPQGVVRFANDANAVVTVSIFAADDAGNRTGPATLTLNAYAAVDLSATDLETGNAAKGLMTGLESLGGNARLMINSDLPVTVAAYARGGDGTLRAMNAKVFRALAAGQSSAARQDPASAQSQVAAQETHRYDVALFYPASNTIQSSRLRLINSGEAATQVKIEARDDEGNPASGGFVQMTLPAQGARTFTARQLEMGDSALFTGRLGTAFGKKRLSVSSDSPIQVMHVTVDSGGWKNLSTTAKSGLAPADAEAFEARFQDHVLIVRDGSGNRGEVHIMANRKLRQSVIAEGNEITNYAGPYRYERIGRGAARITYLGNHYEWYLRFDSAVSGWYALSTYDFDFRGEDWSGGLWRLIPIGSRLDLGIGPDSVAVIAGTAIAAISLPEASGGDGELAYSLSPQVPGLRFDPVTRSLTGTPTQAGDYLMTYQVRDTSGDTDFRHFRITVQGTSADATAHNAGATLIDLPTESWQPDDFSGGTVHSGTEIEIELVHRGWFEAGDYRYTCQSASGCLIRNRNVVSGTVLQTTLDGNDGSASNDHGDDRANATLIEPQSDTAGELTSGDIDYFRIVVSDPGMIEAYTTGGVDTEGRLERADGSVLIYNDDGGSSFNFKISTRIAAGEYFIRVNGYDQDETGSYTLHVRFPQGASASIGPVNFERRQ